VCVVGKIRDLILQLSKSSIYSTKPFPECKKHHSTKK
ncbi:PTS fructose IIA subunit, partial [Klebsiella quasipneumoniae subsp. similipneumoniae]